MTFVLSGEVRISGKTAKGEVQDLQRAQDNLKTSTKKLSAEGKKAAAVNRQTGKSARQAATDYDRLSGAERRAAREARTLGQASKNATIQTRGMTGGMRNLGLQLNQVAQVGGMTGNWMQALAVQLPDMLLGFGAVGIGAGILAGAMIPLIGSWADGGDEAEKLNKIIDDLSESVDGYSEATKRARGSSRALVTGFGSASEWGRQLSLNLAEIERANALEKLRVSAGDLAEQFGGLSRTKLTYDDGVMKEIESTMLALREEFDLSKQHAASLVLALEGINKAASPEDAVRQASHFSDVLLTVFGTASDIPEALREAALAANELALAGGKILFLDEGKPDPFAQRLASARTYYTLSRAESDLQLSAAEDLLTSMREENTLHWAALKFGEDSVEATVLRQQAERAAHEEMLATLGVSESVKDEIRAAFENSLALSELDTASGLSAAKVEAKALAQWLGVSLNAAQTLAAMGPQGRPGTGQSKPGGRGGDPRQFGGSFLEWNTIEGGEFLANWKPPKKPKGGGAGQEAKALARLFEQQQLQLDILRETDPVLREMLRHRQALAGATDEERAALRDLIGVRIEEEEALKNNGDLHDLFKNNLSGGLRGLALEGAELVDVLDNIGMAIADAALQAALLGEGPFGQMFGLSGSGGLLGMLATSIFPGAAIPAAADGGYLSGPGTGTSDSILMWGSNGEFMVNARATAEHRPLLEALNSNAPIPAFAAGGMVSPPSVRSSGGFSQSSPAPIINIVNNSSAPISGEAEQSTDSSGRRTVSMEIADAVGDAMSTPGGGAKRALRNGFGVKPRGTRR